MINEHKKGVKAPKYTKKAKGIEPPKPRNPVAKNATSAIGGGAAGAHKDKKKAAKAGEVKHKKLELAESYDRKLELMLELSVLQQKIAEARKSGADKWRQHFDKETASTRERYNKSKEHYDRLKKDPEYREQEFQKWHQEVHGKKAVAEGLNEASSDEAWELVGQPVPEIQQFVKQMGYGNDEQSVAKITPIIDGATATQIPAASIPKLKNLANKGNDAQTLKAIQQISGRPDAAEQYTRLMQARDAGEGRNRGYPVGDLIQAVKSGNYEAPVLLKLPTGTYVIGGRTRLYAALALGVPAKVKVINANTFAKQGVAEGSDQVKKVFKDKSGKPVGEIGIDPESSPGNGEWYVYHYATGYSVVGFDSAAEAKRELLYVHKHPDAVEGHPSTQEQGVAEGWTHDSLAAELFEMPTYENRLREMLEGQVSFLEGGTEERVTMASKKPGSQHHLNDADQGNIDDMHLRSVHPSDKGDKDEYGMEGEYLRNELHTIMRVCKHLEHSIDDSEDLPTWVIDKMSQAKGMIVMVMDYLISEKEETLDKQSGKEDHMMK